MTARRFGEILRAAARLCALGVAALAGCGGSPQASGPSVTLHITRDFGREYLSSDDDAMLTGRRTMLSLMRQDHEVRTKNDGRSIAAIDGLRDIEDGDGGRTWVTNVNGIETDVYDRDYKLFDGDVVHWDLRDWYVQLDVRATVGAFPETFTRGVFGKPFPVKVLCEKPRSVACHTVKRKLRAAGVRIDGSRPRESGLPPAGNPQRARVVVGSWRHWRNGEWASWIDRSPEASGVFARFSPDARSLHLLDWDEGVVSTAGAGTGLVAAMRPTEEDLMWLITGVDDLGVERAARALGSKVLRDAFAVAVTEDGARRIPLPPR
jgi:hypothetical protein